MENLTNKENDANNVRYEITIKSGSKNKSINHYVKKICKKIMEKNWQIELIAYGNFYVLNRIII